jgi:hypothetical protein
MFLFVASCSKRPIEDGLVGKKKEDLIRIYGKPTAISDCYVSIGRKPEAKEKHISETLYWRRSSGHLYVYLSNESCVESLYYKDGWKF